MGLSAVRVSCGAAWTAVLLALATPAPAGQVPPASPASLEAAADAFHAAVREGETFLRDHPLLSGSGKPRPGTGVPGGDDPEGDRARHRARSRFPVLPRARLPAARGRRQPGPDLFPDPVAWRRPLSHLGQAGGANGGSISRPTPARPMRRAADAWPGSSIPRSSSPTPKGALK